MIFFCFKSILTDSISGCGEEDPGRIDAFYRCIANLDLPTFIATEPICNLDTSIMDDAWSACKDLTIFADFIESNHLTRGDIAFDLIIPVDINDDYSYNISLWQTTSNCFNDLDCFYFVYYNLPFSNPQEVYEIEACHMSVFTNKSHTSTNNLNFVLYSYFTMVQLHYSPRFIINTITRQAITEAYLNTCTTYVFANDVDNCLNYLLESCFEFEIYHSFDPYYCFYDIIYEFCDQFGGDERLKCDVILEEKSTSRLERSCSYNGNEAKCVSYNCMLYIIVNECTIGMNYI